MSCSKFYLFLATPLRNFLPSRLILKKVLSPRFIPWRMYYNNSSIILFLISFLSVVGQVINEAAEKSHSGAIIDTAQLEQRDDTDFETRILVHELEKDFGRSCDGPKNWPIMMVTIAGNKHVGPERAGVLVAAMRKYAFKRLGSQKRKFEENVLTSSRAVVFVSFTPSPGQPSDILFCLK